MKHCLKRGQQRGSEYGFTTNIFKKSSAATPYGRDSNEGKSTVESISALVLISDPAVSKAGHYRLEDDGCA